MNSAHPFIDDLGAQVAALANREVIRAIFRDEEITGHVYLCEGECLCTYLGNIQIRYSDGSIHPDLLAFEIVSA